MILQVFRVSEIRSKCRRLKQEKGLGMILIDYIQLIQGSGRSGENSQQEVSEISRSLKGIAREIEVPLIAIITAYLVELNRDRINVQ